MGWVCASAPGHAFSKHHCLAMLLVQLICECKMGWMRKGQWERASVWCPFCSCLENCSHQRLPFHSAIPVLWQHSLTCMKRKGQYQQTSVCAVTYVIACEMNTQEALSKMIARRYPWEFAKELPFHIVFPRPIVCQQGDV